MRQKLGVALAVVALALSGAREASDQFRQLKSLAGGWATTNAWNSLLVYAAGTFDGRAPERRTALVASNTVSSCDDPRAAARRRAVRATRKPARVKVEDARPLIAELELSHAGTAARRSEVEEFRIEVGRDAGTAARSFVPRFAAEVFETEVAREEGAKSARARLESELSKLRGGEFVIRFTQAETLKGRDAHRRNAPRRRAEGPREAAADAERDGDADSQEALFEAPTDAGLLNCDEEPRR